MFFVNIFSFMGVFWREGGKLCVLLWNLTPFLENPQYSSICFKYLKISEWKSEKSWISNLGQPMFSALTGLTDKVRKNVFHAEHSVFPYILIYAKYSNLCNLKRWTGISFKLYWCTSGKWKLPIKPQIPEFYILISDCQARKVDGELL